ncbi:hypothetical protein L7F22_025047 [Adiantum nelumboides]|nr:hypothetical protein [Adiantum nelumboides]
MDRVGGLDEYLLKLPKKEIYSEKLLHLRNRIAQHYDNKTMLPKGLEEKIRAVLEWNVEQKTKKIEGVGEKAEETSEERIAGLVPESGEEDYLDRLFAKFSMKQEPPKQGPLKPTEEEASPLEFFNKTSDSSNKPSPRPSPEEFPDTLFT